eukprot:4937607-Lingulodinium_polyedra.AAC.1
MQAVSDIIPICGPYLRLAAICSGRYRTEAGAARPLFLAAACTSSFAMGEKSAPVAGSLQMNATWHSRQPSVPAAQIAP